MLKRCVLVLSSFVMLSNPTFANDIAVQEKIRLKSGEWMGQMRQMEKLKAGKKWNDAESIVRKIMAERQELKLDVSGEKTALALIYDASGKTEDAEKMYKELIDDRETRDGIDDYILVPMLNQYAEFLRKHGRAKDATAYEARSKEIEANVNKPPVKQVAAITGDTKLSEAEKYDKLCAMGERLLSSDNPTKAAYALDAAVKLDNGKTKALKLRSQANYQLEKTQQTLSDLNAAVKLDAKDAATLFDRGRAYQSVNKPTLALKDFDASIAIHPDTEVLGYRAKQYAALGKIDLAIADYSAALKLDPRAHWAFIQRAVLYRDNKKDVAAALKDIDSAIALAPKSTDDWELRAETLMKAKRLKEAASDATKMIELDPQNYYGYSFRAKIYKALEGAKSKLAANDLATVEKLRKQAQ